MSASTSRRALLGYAAGAAIVGASGIIGGGTDSASPATSSWDVLYRQWERASRNAARVSVAFHRVHDAWRAGRPTGEHVDLREVSFMPHMRADALFRDDLVAMEAYYRENQGKLWQGDLQAKLDAIERIRNFRAQVSAHDRHHRIDDWSALSDRTDDDLAYAEHALMREPAPHAAAVLWKANHLLSDDGSGTIPAWTVSFVEPVLADLQRMVGSLAA